MTEFNAAQFTVAKAKPTPIILLLDTSASMQGPAGGELAGKSRIDVLNDAVRKMLGTLTKEASQTNEFLVSVITFGGTAMLKQAPAPASEFKYTDLRADGATPLGQAILLAKSLIDDRGQIPSRSNRPTVVLVSDGEPTDEWKGPLESFVRDGRSTKCDRMACAIGHEAIQGKARAVLETFIKDTGHKLFLAEDTGGIYKFFKHVTMSVWTRSTSNDPNVVPPDSTLRPPSPSEPPQTPPLAPPQAPPPAPQAPGTEDSYW